MQLEFDILRFSRNPGSWSFALTLPEYPTHPGSGYAVDGKEAGGTKDNENEAESGRFVNRSADVKKVKAKITTVDITIFLIAHPPLRFI